LVLTIYKRTRAFPKDKLFALTSQMKSSSSSIPTNIAEGCGRIFDKYFCRFLYFSFGSANELEHQIASRIDLSSIESEVGQKLLFQV
jgi:four helix bundle protein